MAKHDPRPAGRLPLAWRLMHLGAFDPPTIPEDLSGLSDDQLTELGNRLVEAFDAARPDANTPEAVQALGTLVEGLERVRAEQTTRAQAAQGGDGGQGGQGGGQSGQGGGGGDGGAAAVDDLNRRVHGEPGAEELSALAALDQAGRDAIAALDDAGREALRTLTAPPAGGDGGTGGTGGPRPAPTAADEERIVRMAAEAMGRAMAANARPLEPAQVTQGRVPARVRQLTPLGQLSGQSDDEARRAREFLAPIVPDTTILAGADIPGFGAGQHLDLEQVAEALVSRRAMFRHTPEGTEERHVVASFTYELPEERRFHPGSERENTRKYRELTDPAANDSLVASGGLCAPVTPLYDIITISGADRPVRDSVASFSADRGGVRFIPPPQWDAASGAVGYITAAVDQAALGGSGAQITAATKPCLHVTCGSPVEYDVAAVTRCLEFSNFTARAWPEQVQAWMTLAMAQQARTAETKLLDAMVAASTQIAEVDDKIGAGRQLLSKITKNAAYLRNRNRMAADAPLNLYWPNWVLSLFQSDFANSRWDDPESLSLARSEIETYLSDYNVNATWYRDSGTGKGQLFNAGAKLAGPGPAVYPPSVVCYLHPPGSFIFGDGGSLDFGIVRDSSLNALNNYRVFAESFEFLAFVGVEALELTFPCLPTGTYAGEAYGSSTLAAPTTFPTNAQL